MVLKMIVGFAVALAAVGADAFVCRPGSSSVALSSSTLTTSTAILETSLTATTSNSEELTTSSTTASTTASIASSSTEESTSSSTTAETTASTTDSIASSSTSSTTSIIISTTVESTSSTTAEATTTLSTTEEPTSSTVIATSTASSEPASCPTEGLVCGDYGWVQSRPGLRYTSFKPSNLEECKAACVAAEPGDCLFLLILGTPTKINNCILFKMSKEEVGFQKISQVYFAYDRECLVC